MAPEEQYSPTHARKPERTLNKEIYLTSQIDSLYLWDISCVPREVEAKDQEFKVSRGVGDIVVRKVLG